MQGLTPARATVLSQYPEPREEEKYPTWKRTLARRARESQMKRFCKAQVTPQGRARSPAWHCTLSPLSCCWWPHAGRCWPAGECCPLLQAIQRRLEEIEVKFRELEQQGIKLEKLLREENGKARVDRAP